MIGTIKKLTKEDAHQVLDTLKVSVLKGKSSNRKMSLPRERYKRPNIRDRLIY